MSEPGGDGSDRRSVRPARIRSFTGDREEWRADEVAAEEPLEIRLAAGQAMRTVAVTLRTPGNDFELAAGFLHAEGVLRSRSEIRKIAHCDRAVGADGEPQNVVTVELNAAALPDIAALERHFFTSSACGVCGKASLEGLRLRGQGPAPAGPSVAPATLTGLPAKLREAQGVFQSTGGLHAAALFDAGGGLLAVREDVGRHNALDKLLGWGLLKGKLPFQGRIVLVSGRASFELVQKALASGVSILCAVSAPSSLAVKLAEEFGLTLVGFLRGDRFNVYTGHQRVAAGAAAPSDQRSG
jgi:FdhD protein